MDTEVPTRTPCADSSTVARVHDAMIRGPMHIEPFDIFTSERLVAGEAMPDGGTEADVARLLGALRSPVGHIDVVGELEAMAAFEANLPWRRRSFAALLTPRFAVGGIAAVMVLGIATATVSGALPRPVQRSVSAGFSEAGISVPAGIPDTPSPAVEPAATLNTAFEFTSGGVTYRVDGDVITIDKGSQHTIVTTTDDHVTVQFPQADGSHVVAEARDGHLSTFVTHP